MDLPVNSELKKHIRLFNWIAPIYNIFFNLQVKNYQGVMERFGPLLDLPEKGRILDIGCGTGALLNVFAERGYDTTGVDMAERMLKMARHSTQNYPIQWLKADITQGLPFPDQSFDLVVSSYVLHGVSYPLREIIYKEARRVSRQQVLFFDYNHGRRFLTDLVEWAEGGDYFNFIRNAEHEMGMSFPKVQKHEVSLYAAIYQCFL